MTPTHPESELVALLADDLAQEIRRVDGNHTLGAGSLADALMPFVIDTITRAAALPQGVSVPDGWVLVPMEAISAAATELTFLDCAEEAANLLNAAISNFGIAAPVAWQVRHFFAGGYWSGWAQAPSEDEAKELVARHAKVGTQAEYRCLYSTTPPPAELGKGDL